MRVPALAVMVDEAVPCLEAERLFNFEQFSILLLNNKSHYTIYYT